LVFGQKQYDINHIVQQGGVYRKKFSDEIVNGEVFQMYGGIKVPLGNMKNGIKEGIWNDWREDGTKKMETKYLNGKETFQIEFDKDGNKGYEITYVDSANYNSIVYYKNGKIMASGEVVDGEYYDGTFFKFGKPDNELRKDFIDNIRKTILTYDNGVLSKIEWFENYDIENEVIVRIDDCINTDDCLDEAAKKLRQYERRNIRLKTEDVEIYTLEGRLHLKNIGSKEIKQIKIKLKFLNGSKIIDEKTERFLFIRPNDDEVMYLGDNAFYEIEVEVINLEYK